MKTNFHFFLIGIFCLLITTDSLAQSWQAQAGMNFSVFNSHDDYRSYNTHRMLKPGWNIGGLYDFYPGRLFSVETGLILETKGEKKDNSYFAPADFTKVIDVVSLLYLDIPVMGKLNIPLKQSKIVIGAGPYMGLAIAGWSESITTPKSNLDSRVPLDFGNKSFSSYHRFDVGGKAMIGIEYQAFHISLFYSGGIKSVFTMDVYNFKMLNQTAGFSVGYRLKH